MSNGDQFYMFSSRSRRTQHRHVLRNTRSDDFLKHELAHPVDWRPDGTAGRNYVFPGSALLNYTCNTPRRHEDMPWCGDGMIVSESLLGLMRQVQPSSVQSALINVQCSECAAMKYSIIWPTVAVDCFDRACSTWQQCGNKLIISDLHIDASRVPEMLHIFRVVYREFGVVVSNHFKSMCADRGMTGCQFYPTQNPW